MTREKTEVEKHNIKLCDGCFKVISKNIRNCNYCGYEQDWSKGLKPVEIYE